MNCFNNVIVNRNELPKNMPGKAFTDTFDILTNIISSVQNNSISDSTLSDLYKLNSYLISKLGKKCYSQEYIFNK